MLLWRGGGSAFHMLSSVAEWDTSKRSGSGNDRVPEYHVEADPRCLDSQSAPVAHRISTCLIESRII